MIIIFETGETSLIEISTAPEEIKNSLREGKEELLFACKENSETGDEFKIRIYALDYKKKIYERVTKIRKALTEIKKAILHCYC